MGYDLHIVRTDDWTDAASQPIAKAEVDALIAADPELAWSKTDYIDMNDDRGVVTRNFMIQWKGRSCFWWYRDQIQGTNPDAAQQLKLAQMARALNARCLGDDNERYEVKRGFLGKEKLVILPEA